MFWLSRSATVRASYGTSQIRWELAADEVDIVGGAVIPAEREGGSARYQDSHGLVSASYLGVDFCEQLAQLIDVEFWPLLGHLRVEQLGVEPHTVLGASARRPTTKPLTIWGVQMCAEQGDARVEAMPVDPAGGYEPFALTQGVKDRCDLGGDDRVGVSRGGFGQYHVALVGEAAPVHNKLD